MSLEVRFQHGVMLDLGLQIIAQDLSSLKETF